MKLDALTTSIAQDYAHLHSATIQSQRRIQQCALDETERAIVALAAELSRQKARRQRLTAVIAGLTAVIGKR